MKPIKVKPQYDRTIWAGQRIKELRHLDESIGTTWDVSFHRNAPLTIEGGPFDGQILADVVREHPEMTGGRQPRQMLRMSILDAGDDLSIQVHPGDEYALEHDNDFGKTESWYIMEAAPGAMIIAGALTDDAEVIRNGLDDGTVMDHVRYLHVTEGDFIRIAHGTLHALGQGVLAAEIGTNSDVTYRFYDYHRKDKDGHERPLHIDKSFDVADFTSRPRLMHFPLEQKDATTVMQVGRDEEYFVNLVDVVGQYSLTPNGQTFFILTAVRNDLEVECEGEIQTLRYSRSLFVPANCSKLTVRGNGRLLVGYSNRK